MKQKTSKYIAAIIIIIGLLFIYFIPNCSGKDELADRYQEIFNNARSILLIENIKIDNDRLMAGTVTALYGSYTNNIGDNKVVGPMRSCHPCHPCGHGEVKTPEGAVILIDTNGSEHKYFINNGVLSINGSSVEIIKKSINTK